jgi:hypothetical protein
MPDKMGLFTPRQETFHDEERRPSFDKTSHFKVIGNRRRQDLSHQTVSARLYPEKIGLISKDLKPLAEIRGNHGSQILQFNPFLDIAGVIRSHSRLTDIPGLSYEKAFPIILHRKADYTRLMVEAAHVDHKHPVGIHAMNAAIRNKFAIIGMGILCKQVQFRCTEC